MRPRIIPVDPLDIDDDKIAEAAAQIRRGGLVAFPTETVYGLGANALDAEAVAGIFSAKKRPLDDPLIVHISDISDLGRLVSGVPEKAMKLIGKFWPGPLTLVLKKTGIVPDIVTTGLDTVALRMPSGVIARKLIDIAGTPIAAPSANLFGKPSPTSAEHVMSDMAGRVDILIDGGETEIGIESTVLAVEKDEALILRPGGVTVEEIQSLIGEVELSSDEGRCGSSPGKYPRHYSPDARVIVADPRGQKVDQIKYLAKIYSGKKQRTGIMCCEENAALYKGYDIKVLGPYGNHRICASRLFRIFREFDSENYDVILAEGVEEKGLGLAVMNRIRKAAGVEII